MLQAAALVTAGFGIWILARACWDYAGLPEFQDRYLQLVEDRLQDPEMEHAANRQESGYLRRLRRSLQARPSPAARAASQEALLQLLNRPSLAPGLQPSAGNELTGLAVAVAAARTPGELAATEKLRRAAGLRLLRGGVPRRFRDAFLPGMARYLDFVGRGSSLGLAVGVLLAGGLSANADLVGALTTLCGVGGAVIFTLTVIRCESRSWPAGQPGVWLRLARSYPQAYFLLRLTLTTAAALLAVYLLRT
ncbi:hypothetical protein [Arthrobacter sp. YD2]|uniref:hypothetical protein n=1 Tax=Arthrobacter sp. YD2 TaxID=3058046 RepID=UPI0025B4C92F|nr:hypothetical protein [Arthrobacter sp. YD2]MDN3905594.1 hypothetical protein [Arthrobacter sp. YD2]